MSDVPLHRIVERMTLEHRQLAHALESGNFEVFRAGLLTHIAKTELSLTRPASQAGTG